MSNGIALGVPPADGGAGGVAGAGAWANADELMIATAQAARVIETIGRMGFSDLSFTFVKFAFVSQRPSITQARGYIGGVNPSLP
jgi:hypothetical protein